LKPLGKDARKSYSVACVGSTQDLMWQYEEDLGVGLDGNMEVLLEFPIHFKYSGTIL
jgi:hypothetical protein